MGKSKESGDSKRKRKRVAVESSSDDDESEQDLEEVNKNFIAIWAYYQALKCCLTLKVVVVYRN